MAVQGFKMYLWQKDYDQLFKYFTSPTPFLDVDIGNTLNKIKSLQHLWVELLMQQHKKEESVRNLSNFYQGWLTDNLFLMIQILKCSLLCSLSFLKTGTTINFSYSFITIIHKSPIQK